MQITKMIVRQMCRCFQLRLNSQRSLLIMRELPLGNEWKRPQIGAFRFLASKKKGKSASLGALSPDLRALLDETEAGYADFPGLRDK